MTDHDGPRIVYVVTDKAGMIPGSAETGFKSAQKFGSEGKSAQKVGSENVSAQKSGGFPHGAHAVILGRGDSVPVYNPRRVHEEFPDRWQRYVRSNFRDLAHIMQVFAVSERTARKWWKGETGANGGHVAIAVNEHPVAAPRMLFAAE